MPAVADTAAALTGEFADPEAGGPGEPTEWWQSFNEPALDRVVEAVLAYNFDLAAAVARVEQARTTARIASAGRVPALQPSLGETEFDTPTNAGIGAQLDELGLDSDVYDALGFALPERLGLTTYSLGATFSYELDFWGRNRNAALAAGAERLASEADYRAAHIGVVAETVGTYLEIADLRLQRRLAAETVELLAEREALTASRYDRGLTDAPALYAARRNVRSAQAELALIDGRLADAESRLWILLGGEREAILDIQPEGFALAATPEPVPEAIQAGLLAQRPDVNAARQRMESARYAVGARRAELLPSLSLSGAIGLQSTESAEWFDPDQWFRNLTMNLIGPAFQGARLRSNLALAEARLDEAAAAYGRSVVAASQEVRAALGGLQSARRHHELRVALTEEARADAQFQERRYLAGVADYESFLVASQSLLAAESALGSAQRDLGLARLALHRALGGALSASEAAADRRTDPAPAAGGPLASAFAE